MSTLLPLLLSSVLGCGSGLVAGGSAPAEANHPDEVALAIADLLTYQTAYVGSGPGGVLQVDVAQQVMTYDCAEARVHWDGTRLWIHRQGEVEPDELSSEWAARVGAVWSEWRAGFPNTQFVADSPRAFDPKAREAPGRRWYRVMLPFAWASAYRIHVQVMANGRAGALSVYDAATLQPLTLGKRKIGRETVEVALREATFRPAPHDTNVPLSPETYSPYRPSRQPSAGGWSPGRKPGPHGEWSAPTWHQEQQFVRLVRVDTNPGSVAGPQLAARCETATQESTAPLTVRFAFPSDPERADLARQAAFECPNAAYHSSLTVFHHVSSGAKTCATGAWQIVNTLPDPDVVLWQRQVNECRNVPDDARLEYPTDLPVPPGSDPTGIEVQFAGTVKIKCSAVGGNELSDIHNVLAGFEPEGQPTLAWPGCYPGWSP